MRFLVLILFVTTISHVFAQADFRPGYIVKDGDTLKGFVRYNNRKYSEKVIFKSRRGKKAAAFGTGEVSAYGFAGDRKYEAKEIATSAGPKKLFWWVLQEGEIDLYYSREKYLLVKNNEQTILGRKQDTIVSYQMNKNTEHIYNSTSTYGITHLNSDRKKEDVFFRDYSFRTKLDELVADCNLSARYLQYSRKQILGLVSDYNQCKDNIVDMKNKRPWIRIGASFGFGAYNSSSMKLDSLKGTKLPGDVSRVQEFNAELRFPRVMDRVWIAVGFQPNITSTYTASTSRTSTVETREDDLTLVVKYFKVPVSFKYSLGNPSYSFFIRAGIWQGRLQDAQYTAVRTTRVGSNAYVTDMKVNAGYRNPSGGFVGFGYDQKIVGRMRLFGELRYEANNGMIGKMQSIKSNFNFFTVFVGIGI